MEWGLQLPGEDGQPSLFIIGGDRWRDERGYNGSADLRTGGHVLVAILLVNPGTEHYMKRMLLFPTQSPIRELSAAHP